MRNTINDNIEKFISGNRHSSIVEALFEANETRDRERFVSCLESIKRCIEIQRHRNELYEDIKYMSSKIRQKKVEIRKFNGELKQLRDGCIVSTEFTSSLFDEMEIEV